MGVLDLVHLDPLEAGGPPGALFREQGEHGPGAVEEIGEIEGVSLVEVLVIGEEGGANRGGGSAGFLDGAAHVLGSAVGEGDAEGDLRRHAGGDDGGEAVGHEAGLAGAYYKVTDK